MQGCLFALSPDRLAEVLADLRVSMDEFLRWRQNGWISFGLEMRGKIEQYHVSELEIVRDTVRSGLSDSQLHVLLADLPRPLDVGPDRISYSFAYGWVVTVPYRWTFETDLLFLKLDWLKENGGDVPLNFLNELKDLVESLIGERDEAD